MKGKTSGKEKKKQEKFNLKEVTERQLQQREDDVEKTAKSHQRKTEHSKGFCRKEKFVIVFGLKEEVLPIRHATE